jgi:hypothetical protein
MMDEGKISVEDIVPAMDEEKISMGEIVSVMSKITD